MGFNSGFKGLNHQNIDSLWTASRMRLVIHLYGKRRLSDPLSPHGQRFAYRTDTWCDHPTTLCITQHPCYLLYPAPRSAWVCVSWDVCLMSPKCCDVQRISWLPEPD